MLEEVCGWLVVLFIVVFVIGMYMRAFKPTPEPTVRRRYRMPPAVEQKERTARISNELQQADVNGGLDGN